MCIFQLSLYYDNKSQTLHFQARRGLRQRDSLYLFLFIIYAESIYGLLRNACTRLGFTHFIISENLEFNIFQFADDTSILDQAYRDNIWTIKSVLCDFELASEL